MLTFSKDDSFIWLRSCIHGTASLSEAENEEKEVA
jgi:hypothetical protein